MTPEEEFAFLCNNSPLENDLLRSVEKFASKELLPAAAETAESGRFVLEQLRGLADLGVMGINLPEDAGGLGTSPQVAAQCIEAIAGACASTASALTAHFLATECLLHGGPSMSQKKLLTKAGNGDALGSFALTEPACGSHPADLETIASEVPEGFRLKGSKQFISNAAYADFIIVFARHSKALEQDQQSGNQKSHPISAFIVEKNTPGVSFGSPESTMGLKGGHVFEISLDCILSKESLLGVPGKGFKLAMQALNSGRIDVAAMCNGIAQSSIDMALEWTKIRKVNATALSSYQGVQWMLADMQTQLCASRALTRQACELKAANQAFSQTASMVKLFASEMAAEVTDKALQLHGGYGYTTQLALERLVRDVRIMRIYEGASEVQRNIIAGHMLDH